jgi:hypothetical protein
VPRQQVGGLLRTVDDEDALAVVPTAGGLEDDGPAVDRGEVLDVPDGDGAGPGRLRLPGRGERVPQDELVLGVDERGRPRCHPVAALLERREVLGGHVLVVERHDGGALGQALEVGQLAVVADVDVGGDERGGLRRVGREDAEGLAERDGGLVGHAGQLPAADHRDHRQAGAAVEWRGHGEQ